MTKTPDHNAEQRGEGDAEDLALGTTSNFRDGAPDPLPAAEMPDPDPSPGDDDEKPSGSRRRSAKK